MNKKISILYIDDEEKSLKYFKKILQGEFNIILTNNPKDAIKLIKDREDIGVVLSDQRMPNVDGVHLLDNIKKVKPEIIRLITTAYSDLEETIKAVNIAGVYRYINKPWNISELKEILSSAVDLYVTKLFNIKLQKEKRRTMLSLAGYIAHELRTPLLSIRLEANEIKNVSDGIINCSKSHESLINPEYHKVTDAAENINFIINQSNILIDILLTNASDNPDQTQIDQSFSCRDTTISALKSYPFTENQLNIMSIDIRHDYLIRGSNIKFKFVVYNLIKNSLRAIMEKGNGKISITSQDTTSTFSLIFHDTGIGIKRDLISFIFNDFFTHSSTNNLLGVGIGLSFCKKTIEQLNGKITCESEPGHFTKMIISFNKNSL